MLSPKEILKVSRARKHGIVYPLISYQESKRAGLEFAILCAVLMKETSGGHNVFGHDPTICIGWGTVTESKYLEYLHRRERLHKYQGIGPMQLTYYAYQDKADFYGGCWVPRNNIRVGAEKLARDIRRNGLLDGLSAYNGSRAYGLSVLSMVKYWRSIL